MYREREIERERCIYVIYNTHREREREREILFLRPGCLRRARDAVAPSKGGVRETRQCPILCLLLPARKFTKGILIDVCTNTWSEPSEIGDAASGDSWSTDRSTSFTDIRGTTGTSRNRVLLPIDICLFHRG